MLNLRDHKLKIDTSIYIIRNNANGNYRPKIHDGCTKNKEKLTKTYHPGKSSSDERMQQERENVTKII